MPDAAPMPSSRSTLASPGEPAIREVFLSPRVVDREAFNDYAGSLRRLIEQASGQAEGLRTAASEADQARSALRELTGKHQAKFDLAARLVQTLDQRAGEAERLLQSARDAAATLDALRGDADKALAEHAARLDARIEQAAQATRERLEAMEQRMLDRLEALEAAALARVTAAADQAAQTIAQRRAESEAAARTLADQLATTQQRAAAALASIDRRSAQVETDLAGHLDRFGHSLDTELETRRQALSIAGDRAAETLRGEERRVLDVISRIETIAAEAETLIGLSDDTDAGAPPMPGSLAALLEQAGIVRDQAERSTGELNAARLQAEQAVSALSRSVDDGQARLDALTRLAEQISTAAQTAAAAGERADATLKSRLQAIDEAVARPMQELQERTDTARASIETLLTRAERSRQASESVMSDAWALFQALDKQLTELRPWRPVLLDGDTANPQPIPAPIQDLIDQVRGELARDLSVVAAGMYQLAVKAQKASGALDPARPS